jgi:hypothetical protein
MGTTNQTRADRHAGMHPGDLFLGYCWSLWRNAARTCREASTERKPLTVAVASRSANSRSYNSWTFAGSVPVSRASASMVSPCGVASGAACSVVCMVNRPPSFPSRFGRSRPGPLTRAGLPEACRQKALPSVSEEHASPIGRTAGRPKEVALVLQHHAFRAPSRECPAPLAGSCVLFLAARLRQSYSLPP